jgi:D-alanine-D-alanine ligase
MKVAVLHGHVPQKAPKDEQDVLVQVEAVSRALCELGHEPVAVPFTLDLQAVAHTLQHLCPAVVFNLVESVAGQGQFIYAGPMLLDALHLPYTGATTAAMFATSNKVLAKKVLLATGIPTPPWLLLESVARDAVGFAGPYILKSVWEHGSIGLDDEAVLADQQRLISAAKRQRPGGPWFVERYIDGREFNVGLLAAPHDTEILPVAEIEFVDYPQEKVRIVGYQAKWEEDSFEYQHTPRRFDFPPQDTRLLERLAALARACWHGFALRGYARVDFRVDHAGHPWVLEVNANPCLAPDSGFVAAAERAGLRLTQVIQRILEDIIAVSELTV